jgi:hypothetical protein
MLFLLSGGERPQTPAGVSLSGSETLGLFDLLARDAH